MIKNGKDTSLAQSSGTLPNVSSAMNGWFQQMIFNVLTKTVVNHVAKETSYETSFKGVWQSMSAQQIQMKPEGQRFWLWYTVHSDTSLMLKIDDIVDYQEKKYRVQSKVDHILYGYFEYHLVEDYE